MPGRCRMHEHHLHDIGPPSRLRRPKIKIIRRLRRPFCLFDVPKHLLILVDESKARKFASRQLVAAVSEGRTRGLESATTYNLCATDGFGRHTPNSRSSLRQRRDFVGELRIPDSAVRTDRTRFGAAIKIIRWLRRTFGQFHDHYHLMILIQFPEQPDAMRRIRP